jgi:hypothetical protein
VLRSVGVGIIITIIITITLPSLSSFRLFFLQLGYNKISSWSGLSEIGASLKDLRVIYLEHNPIAKEWEYRIKLKKTYIPQLTQIDAVEIRASAAAAPAGGAGAASAGAGAGGVLKR